MAVIDEAQPSNRTPDERRIRQLWMRGDHRQMEITSHYTEDGYDDGISISHAPERIAIDPEIVIDADYEALDMQLTITHRDGILRYRILGWDSVEGVLLAEKVAP